jgi:hypothetical protein
MAGIFANAIPALWLIVETIVKEKQTSHAPSVHFLSFFWNLFWTVFESFKLPQLYGSFIAL